MNTERELSELQAEVKGLKNKYVPVSEERLGKLWHSVRESLDGFHSRMAELEARLRQQEARIVTLNNMNQTLQKTVAQLLVKEHSGN